MVLENIKNYIFKVLDADLSKNQKIFITSLVWVIFIGYLTWWNGLKSQI